MTPLISACIDGRVGCVRALLQSPEADVRHHVDTLIVVHHVTRYRGSALPFGVAAAVSRWSFTCIPIAGSPSTLLAAAVCCARGEHS